MPMKTILALIILGWTAAVTFCGPELYRLINGPEQAKPTKPAIRRVC
mgnify:CR=1 FL=1